MFAFLSGLDFAAVAVVAGVILSVLHDRRKVTVQVGQVSATLGEKLDAVAATVNTVEHHVNNRPAGSPTVSQDVRQIADTLTMIKAAQDDMTPQIERAVHLASQAVSLAEVAALRAAKVADDLAAYRLMSLPERQKE